MADEFCITPDYYVCVNGVKVARLLPDERAIELPQPRTGRHRKDRRPVVVRLDTLAAFCRNKT